MNQYAADQIALVATLTQARKRTRRWKLIAGCVVVASVAHQFSGSIQMPPAVTQGVVRLQQAAVPAAPAATPVQQPAAQSELTPTQRVVPSAEDRRREAAAAARARRRYDTEMRRMQPPPAPQPPQRIAQPERIVPPSSRPSPSHPGQGMGLGTILTTAAQAARVAEQIERGRFSPSRELTRAARQAERAERRRQRAERWRTGQW